MSFVQRLLNYVLNDVAVKTLANSKSFQQFAVKTHRGVTEAKNFASDGASAGRSAFERNVPKVREFATAFREELQKDLKKSK